MKKTYWGKKEEEKIANKPFWRLKGVTTSKTNFVLKCMKACKNFCYQGYNKGNTGFANNIDKFNKEKKYLQ